MLKAISATAVAVLAATFAAPGVAQASVAPPDGVLLEVVGVGGTGCPPGTATVSASDRGDEFSVLQDSFVAMVGVGAGSASFRMNCQIALRVHAPEGYSYAITGVDHRGYMSLAGGASAVQRTSYYFSGQAATSLVTHQFRGPLSDDWQATDVVDIASLVFSPCGVERNLNINTDVTVRAGTSNPATTTSLLTVDETAGDLYRFTWRRCN